MKNLYRITWKEHHEIDVEAEDAEEAVDLGTGAPSEATLQATHETEAEVIGGPETIQERKVKQYEERQAKRRHEDRQQRDKEQEDRRAQGAADRAVSLDRAKDRESRQVLTVSIELENSAFDGEQGRHEVANTLEELAGRIREVVFLGEPLAWRTRYPLKDRNGNSVGVASVEGLPTRLLKYK